ncbi:MAG: DUF975 family protein [Clostridiales bacterium]|nr:DUF975 family protein [Clostridiales bacterium]
MLFAEDFRSIARERLSGKWALAVGTGFVAGLLGASTTSMSSGGAPNSSRNAWDSSQDLFNGEIGIFLRPWIIAFIVVVAVWVIVCFIIGGAVTLGYVKFNLNLVDRKEASFDDLFSQFNRLGAGFCMQFLRGLYVFLWSLLLIIPGIIASYSYAMTPFIMYEHPEYTASEAINLSKKMMKGNKWRLFCLDISFIGWILLSLLTLGIGLLWVGPYMEAANAAFYREISGTNPIDDQVINSNYMNI